MPTEELHSRRLLDSVRMEAASLDGEPRWSRCSARSSRSLLAPASASVPSASSRGAAGRRRAAKPTPGSGIATKAALSNPKCQTGPTYGAYGQLDGAIVGGGPVCTRPFKAGENNSGTTSPGVTKDAISVVYVLGSVPETRAQPATNTQTGAPGPTRTPRYDLLLAMRSYYETWGREIDVKFYTSTGTRRGAQTADAVAIKAMKPFAVVNSYNAVYGTMAIELAKAKILVYDAETGREDFTVSRSVPLGQHGFAGSRDQRG